MGYRSEVALTLKKEDGLELIRQAKENEPVRNLMSCANIIDQNEFITFHWKWVKWYGSFEEVRFITCFYQNLDKYKGVAALLYGDGTDRTAELAALVYRKQLCTECDAEFCVFNPEGICMLPFVTGKAPRLGDDGCEDYTAQEGV